MNLLSLLIAPLQAVVLFFAPHAGAYKATSARTPSRTPSHTLATADSGILGASALAKASHTDAPTAQPFVFKPVAQHSPRLRIVRNVDASLPADRAGRMVVSGRFADVCAELDRLAALEMRVAC